MEVIKNDRNVFFDIDDTLIMWDWDHEIEDKKKITISQGDFNGRFFPHQRHIDFLIQSAGAGKMIFVWSQNGSEWATIVVKALKLEKYVDYVMSKPVLVIDDLPKAEILKDRIYFEL